MRRFQGSGSPGSWIVYVSPKTSRSRPTWSPRRSNGPQRQVESQNFEIRKNVLKYDEVMNRQREVVYEWRRSILEGTAGDDLIGEWIDSVVTEVVESRCLRPPTFGLGLGGTST